MPRRFLLAAAGGLLSITTALFSVGMVSAQQAVATPTTESSPPPVTAVLASTGPAVAPEIAAEAVAAAWAVNNPMFTCIRWAESNNRYEVVSGAYGILISSWQAYRGVWAPFGEFPTPGDAPKSVQDLVAYHLYRVGGGYGGWHDYCTDR
jgi:hypothetical protein